MAQQDPPEGGDAPQRPLQNLSWSSAKLWLQRYSWIMVFVVVGAIAVTFNYDDARHKLIGYGLIIALVLYLVTLMVVSAVTGTRIARTRSNKDLPSLFLHWGHPFVWIFWAVSIFLIQDIVKIFFWAPGSEAATGRGLIELGLLLSFWFIVASVYIFTWEMKEETDLQPVVRFAYIFTILALLFAVHPLFFLSLSKDAQKMLAREPIGVMQGCRLIDMTENSAGSFNIQKCVEYGPQWMVNVGGSIIGFWDVSAALSKDDGKIAFRYDAGQPAPANGTAPPDDGAEHALRIYVVSGGVVVPLFVVSLSLVGASVGMMRRVPEYQRRANPSYKGKTLTDDGEPLPAYLKRPLSELEIRERLIFQILQVISAPFIAIVAYYIFDPDNAATAVVIGFTSGFASELILLRIRQAADALRGSAVGSPPPSADHADRRSNANLPPQEDDKNGKKADAKGAAKTGDQPA